MPSYVFDRATMQMVDKNAYYLNRAVAIVAKRSNIGMPYIRSDLPPYQSPITGKMIEGRAARREDLARSGCREIDPSEYKPTYKNYEFCQKRRLPYMGGDVPPPMTADEKAWAQEKRAKIKSAEKAADAVRAKAAEAKTDPDLAKFQRGNPKNAPLFTMRPEAPTTFNERALRLSRRRVKDRARRAKQRSERG